VKKIVKKQGGAGWKTLFLRQPAAKNGSSNKKGANPNG
jgi:hypothetical protein